MGFQEAPVVWLDREPTLDEEIDALAEGDVFEMANLVEAQTGVAGTIFISTIMGSHGPRVKYYPRRGGQEPSFSVAIASEPRVVANSLPHHELARMAPAVLEWTRLNHEALSRFWWEGKTWSDPEVTEFKKGLKKV